MTTATRLLAAVLVSVLAFAACSGDDGAPNENVAAGPDARVEAETPTPNQAGTYQGLTIEQAQELMPFEILIPSDLPEAFELTTVIVESEPLQSGSYGDPIEVTFYFTPVNGTEEDLVQVSQRKGRAILGSEGERSEIEIIGESITRSISSYDDGREIAGYNWRTEEFSISVHAILGEGVETDDLEKLIEALLQP